MTMRAALKAAWWIGLGLLLAVPAVAAGVDPAPDPKRDWSGYLAWCSRHGGQAEVGGQGVTCRPLMPPRAEPPGPNESPSSVDWEDFRAKQAEAEEFRRTHP